VIRAESSPAEARWLHPHEPHCGVEAGLIAVSGVIGLMSWTVRNATIYADIGRMASTEADLATSLILARAGMQASSSVQTQLQKQCRLHRDRRDVSSFPNSLSSRSQWLSAVSIGQVTRLNPTDSTLLASQLANLLSRSGRMLPLSGSGERMFLVGAFCPTIGNADGQSDLGVPTNDAQRFLANTSTPFSFSFSHRVRELGAWQMLG